MEDLWQTSQDSGYLQVSYSQGVEVSGATSSATRGNAQGETGAQQSSSGDYTYGPPTVVNKRRGRPAVGKDKKKRKRRTKAELKEEYLKRTLH